jgi:hypothetical protein
MSVEAMRQALEALSTTDTHPLSSVEQYDKEMLAMEALRDAIADAIEQEKQRRWKRLTEGDIYRFVTTAPNYPTDRDLADLVKNVEMLLKEKNHA